MIAVDTSALMAILLNESEANACAAALEAEDRLLISAAGWRNVGEEAAQLIDGLGFEIVSVTPASARRVAGAYEKWGKGLHPASLNFGDCFAYEMAKEHDCALLYVGEDFSQTDIEAALG
jgi:ribonuclease VapC